MFSPVIPRAHPAARFEKKASEAGYQAQLVYRQNNLEAN